jgi:hypothetical protein
VRQQLEELAAATEGRSSDSGLLLAYLGYQTDTVELTRYGLDLAAAAEPEDALLAILRTVWLRGDTESDDQTPTGEATTPDQAEPTDDGDAPVSAQPAEQPMSTSQPVEVQVEVEVESVIGAEPVGTQQAESQGTQDHAADELPQLDLDALDAALDPEK